MTLQERMVAVYLRQAKLPPEEKDKLRLFLGLLLETFEEEEPWERELDSPSAQHSTAQHSTAQHSTAQHSTAQHSTARRRRRRPLPLAWIQLGLQTVHPKAAMEKKGKRWTMTL